MLSEIFYLKCIGCGYRSENGLPICDDCIEELEKHPHECESCGYPSNIPAKVCGMCKSAVYRDRIRIAYKYKGAIRQFIKEIKFAYRVTGAKTLKKLVENEMIGDYDIISDVPSHYSRKLRRLNHPAQGLAEHMANLTNIKYAKILTRTRRTEYQYKLKKNERHVNVMNAFSCARDVDGLRILLIDDIITTGSTTEECSRILKCSGASKVDVFALTGGHT
ncbi:competence protein F [Denitrovibrio acetiphilus DSM 12809]|uniref:Competence protein F n=1 Tax=Denitrovibrio acetiphilus (strain DSM 12809 / NBRC 114555 / N2460) TaxID=522772 RepID=D4H6J5_DENA2|nr:ComF family protein [Denitrovibrio acetiphilus]ADD69669.1 competence protein F [Denitrovibrio acetiphilus DSM 12809]